MNTRHAQKTVGALACYMVALAGSSSVIGQVGGNELQRIANPAPVGQSGALFVMAPEDLCADPAASLEVRFNDYTFGAGVRPAFRTPLGGSTCHWQVDRVAPGDYDAVIRRHRLIVAQAPAVNVEVQSVATLTLRSAAIEVTGQITINGAPPPSPMILLFSTTAHPINEWQTLLDDEGRYRITLDGAGTQHFVARILEGSNNTLNFGPNISETMTLWPGVHVFDKDITAAPGVLHLEVASQAIDGFDHNLGVRIEGDRRNSRSGNSFRIKDGFRATYRGMVPGEVSIVVLTNYGPSSAILVRQSVTLTPEHPERSVRIVIPPDELRRALPPPGLRSPSVRRDDVDSRPLPRRRL